MRRIIIALAAVMAVASAQAADNEIKIGVTMGFTGPIESLAQDMAAGAELAIEEANDSKALLGGASVTPVRGDTTCVDSAAASAAAERLITADRVNAIAGGDCSGVTTAMLQNVAMPNGVVMISPSATSPALSTLEDNGLFFRTAPSDARQGQVISEVLKERGVSTVALARTHGRMEPDRVPQLVVAPPVEIALHRRDRREVFPATGATGSRSRPYTAPHSRPRANWSCAGARYGRACPGLRSGGGGVKGSIGAHSSSVRSLAYRGQSRRYSRRAVSVQGMRGSVQLRNRTESQTLETA